jgi:hypothetical protein
VRVNEHFGIDLPLSGAFHHPTIAGLSAAVEAEVRAQVAAMPEDEVLPALRQIENDDARRPDGGAAT